MAYADLSAVKARAGALARAWSDTSTPTNSDIAGFLDDTAAEIDALLEARGLTPPASGTAAATALRGLNASAALVIALEATYPDSSGLASASALIGELRADVTTWSKELLDGTHPAIALLSSGSSAPHAANFWEQEGDSFGTLSCPDARDRNPFTSAGPIGRGQRF